MGQWNFIEEVGGRTDDRRVARTWRASAANAGNRATTSLTLVRTVKAADSAGKSSEMTKAVVDSSRYGHMAPEGTRSSGQSVDNKGKAVMAGTGKTVELFGNTRRKENSRGSRQSMKQQDRDQSEQSPKGDLKITGPKPKDTLDSSDGPVGMELGENQNENGRAGLKLQSESNNTLIDAKPMNNKGDVDGHENHPPSRPSNASPSSRKSTTVTMGDVTAIVTMGDVTIAVSHSDLLKNLRPLPGQQCQALPDDGLQSDYSMEEDDL